MHNAWVPRRSTLDLWDHKLDGKVVPLLRDFNAGHRTLRATTRALWDLGLEADSSTIYRWAKSLDGEGDAA